MRTTKREFQRRITELEAQKERLLEQLRESHDKGYNEGYGDAMMGLLGSERQVEQ